MLIDIPCAAQVEDCDCPRCQRIAHRERTPASEPHTKCEACGSSSQCPVGDPRIHECDRCYHCNGDPVAAREHILAERDKQWEQAIRAETIRDATNDLWLERVRKRLDQPQEASLQETIEDRLRQVSNHASGYGPDVLTGVAAEIIALLEGKC